MSVLCLYVCVCLCLHLDVCESVPRDNEDFFVVNCRLCRI